MQKNNKIKGYMAYHKEVPYGIWNEEILTPIQANAENNGKITTYGGVYDNEGENISKWNDLFAETTCIYWIWKHLPEDCKYVLFTQYRRRFDVHTAEAVEEVFKESDAILAEPLFFGCSIRGQYNTCHNPEDLERIKNIVIRLYPEYEKSWQDYVENGHYLFYSNGLALRAEDYKKYCEWLFSILFEFQKEMGFKSPEEVQPYIENEIKAGKRRNANGQGKPDGALKYQSQLCGFISERLLTLYVRHNFSNIYIVPYLKMEAI